jgi:hypothetical protein
MHNKSVIYIYTDTQTVMLKYKVSSRSQQVSGQMFLMGRVTEVLLDDKYQTT